MGTVIVQTKDSGPSVRLLRLLLLAQDTSDVTKILRELKDAGLEIAPCVAENQLELQSALNGENFDAVISTWTFAESDGQEALRVLR